MRDRVHNSPNLIYSAGTQVVTRKPVPGPSGRVAHPSGAVGVIVKSPQDRQHAYRVRFTDGFEAALHHDNLMLLAEYKQGSINDSERALAEHGLFDRVLLRCVIGSRAYGLDDENSDIDRRGVYLPPADLHWSLFGVPEQLESDETQEAYWELQKFIILALKANPNVLECLYTPVIESPHRRAARRRRARKRRRPPLPPFAEPHLPNPCGVARELARVSGRGGGIAPPAPVFRPAARRSAGSHAGRCGAPALVASRGGLR